VGSVVGIVATIVTLVCCLVSALPRTVAIVFSTLAFVSYSMCYGILVSVLTGPTDDSSGCGAGVPSGTRCVCCKIVGDVGIADISISYLYV
jgi:hypothetical protein